MTALVREPRALAAGAGLAPDVVGIGASAGGIEALQALLSQLQPNGRTAYVVAQHMAGESHHELVSQLLQRACALPVRLMTTSEQLVPDAVTLVPSGCDASWQAGHWLLQPPSVHHFSTPSIDELLTSLGEGLGSAAVGVILSGAGSDGARGAAVLRRRGGSIWIQSPAQARFAGMPNAALQAVPDAMVARVEEMAWDGNRCDTAVETGSRPTSALDVLISEVRRVTHVDFSGYKTETLQRRAARRQAELGLPTLDDYASYLTAESQEPWVLQRRFLVSVSSFFRERAAFEALGRARRLMEEPRTATWRCWVPACATGEEAYTLAMLHAEGQREGASRRQLDMLATDLSDDALAHARRAVYSEKDLLEVGYDLCQRYFTADADAFQIKRSLRETVRFEKQDVLAEMPEGPWNLISCRNLLIYLKTPQQERLIEGFHERLAVGGWLLLSPSESLPQACAHRFTPFDMSQRIYRRVH